LHLPCLCESSFVDFSFSHPTPTPNSKTSLPNAPDAHPFRTAPLAKIPVKLPLFGLVKLPLCGLLTSAYTLLRGFPPPTPAKTFSDPPLSTLETGSLHLEDSLLLMMFLFGHSVEIRRCSFQRHADDSHLPKVRFVLVERSHYPRVSHCSRPSPIPCNVSGVLRGRIPITVPSTRRRVFTERLRSSSGHGGGWRTGVDFQNTGFLPHSVQRLSFPWGRPSHDINLGMLI
jgi:hypothetical protein